MYRPEDMEKIYREYTITNPLKKSAYDAVR